MAKTRKVSRSRARSYRRRGRVSPCRGKGPAVCRSLKSCKYSRGKKRTFCRRSNNSSRKNRSLGKITRTGRKYGGSRMGGSRMGGSRMGGSRRRSRRAGSRMGGSRKRRAGTFGILEQAVVPGSLLLANTYYKSKGYKGKKRRSRRFRKSRR